MKAGSYQLLFLFINLFVFTEGYTQIQSTLGWFEVNFQQGCPPLDVSVRTAIPESDVPIFQFNGRDDLNQVQWLDSFDSLTHTYTTEGIYIIYLTVQNANPVRSDSIKINVLKSIAPLFEVRECTGNGALVEIQDNFYDSYITDFGDGTLVATTAGDPDPVHFYSVAGTYNITLSGRLNNAPNNCGSSSKSFTSSSVIIPPFISMMEIDTINLIILRFNLPQNVNYRMEISQGNNQLYQFFKDLVPTDSLLIIPNFSPDINEFCFRIAALNPCGGQRVNSNEICTITSMLLLKNNENEVTWRNILTGNEKEYRISRNTIRNYITVPSGQSQFNDMQVQCETQYCYSVTIVYNDGSESLSPEICGISFSTDIPPIIEDLVVDIVSDGVRLDWDRPGLDTAFIVQYNNSNEIIFKDTAVVNTKFIATDLKEYPQTCYTHNYRDVCGNFSKPTDQICSMYLVGKSDSDGSVSLSWTEFTGLKDSISDYTLLKYDIDGVLFETLSLGIVFGYVDAIDGQKDQIVSYVIEATPSNKTFKPLHSNRIEQARRPQLHFPTAFTPNDDGLNDIFKPEHLFIDSYDLKVYNRWGQLLFSTNDIEEGWDGSFNGSMVSTDSYTFLSNATDFQGLQISRSGIVTLLKN